MLAIFSNFVYIFHEWWIDNTISFLYARLQTGRIMIWWCPSVRPSQVSVRQSQFSSFFSYMLWHIELKFCMSLSSYEYLIKFECRQFASIFVGVMPLLELNILEIHRFSAVFSYMLWHIGLKFCIWFCFAVLQITFECYQFASIFVGVMPLLELRKYTVFRSFSYMLRHIGLKFCTWLCFAELQIKFECRQFVSIFVGVMPLLELRILEIHSLPLFSLTCFDILSRNFAYDFVILYYISSLGVVNLCQFFVGVMPLLDIRILKKQSIPDFSDLHALTY